MAYPIFYIELRRPVNCCRWSPRSHSLQFNIRKMENFPGSGSRASIRGQRRSDMVPSRSYRGSRGFEVVSGLVSHTPLSSNAFDSYPQIRLYSRDLELTNQNVLHREVIQTPVIVLSLVDNSLLVYTADNTLSHYLIVPTAATITLQFCGSITFDGIIATPSAVRVLSWMIPSAQKRK